jgi:ATP-dependent DNA helicase RecG
MALPVNINELINGKVIEWERLEFEKGWNPETVIHSICAFANDINNWGGGYVIIGIEESNGRPVLPPHGLNPNQIDRIQGELTELCYQLQPHYIPVIQPYFFQDKHILLLYTPSGDLRPYTAPETIGNKNIKNRFHYIRSGSKTIKAKGEALRRLRELSARVPFDDRSNMTARLNDLNLGLIRDFLQEVKSDLFEESITLPFDDLCRQMNIVKGPDEALQPVNVGLMFFNREPHRFFNRAWIEVVIRKDEAGKDFSEKYFKGPLHIQLRDALAYIYTNIIAEKVKKIPGQAESMRLFNFPYEAVEEALANAVYHKSYELGKPIEVQIWPDKIEILSFPGPVPPVNAQILAENKRIVARDYRNRRLGDFLKELHLTEGRGTGIPTIYKAMANNKSPVPIFETDDQCTYFLTVVPVNPEFSIQQGIQDSTHESNQESNYESNQENNYESNQESNYESNQENNYENIILAFCFTPKTRLEILSKLELSNQTKNFNRYVKPLLDKGWLRMTIPEKPKDRNQKYQTTATGRQKTNKS